MGEPNPQLVELLSVAERILVFTGAGISTGSGIADYRGPKGIWKTRQPVYYQEFMDSEEARVTYWEQKLQDWEDFSAARPNAVHRAVARLQEAGRLQMVVTQNIDGLHQAGGVSPGRVIEIHGTNLEAECLGCGVRTPIEEIQCRLDAGETEVRCDLCGGLVKPATIMFGQSMPAEEMRRAWECAAGCDLLFMFGSCLPVAPAASLPRVARERGASLIFINRTETQFDELAEIISRESAGEFMTLLLDELGSGFC